MTGSPSHQAARELRRQHYLQAMGVDSYIARRPLAGAALCPRLVIRPAELEAHHPEPEAPPAVKNPVPTQLREPRAPVPPESTATSEPTAGASPQPAPARPEAFSVAAIVCGGVLWLEELSQPFLAQEQVQLLQSLSFALGLPGGRPEITQFDWPIHQNTQFDLGEAAARAGLSSFAQRRLEQSRCSALVVLGEPCAARLAGLPDGVRVLRTVSTAQMIRDGRSKRQAWLDLRPLWTARG